MNRGAWRATVHGVTKSRTRQKRLSTQAHKFQSQNNTEPAESRASLGAQMVKNLPALQKTQVWSMGWEAPLEKRTATHSSILAWRIPWTEEPDRLSFMGSQIVGHNWETNCNPERLHQFTSSWHRASALAPCSTRAPGTVSPESVLI